MPQPSGPVPIEGRTQGGCPQGSSWNGEQCVHKQVVTEVECPAGTMLRDGKCVAAVSTGIVECDAYLAVLEKCAKNTFANGPHVYLVWTNDWESTNVAVIDVSEPAKPRLTGKLQVPSSLYAYDLPPQLVPSGDGVVQIGSTLVFRHVATPDDGYGYGYGYDCSGQPIDPYTGDPAPGASLRQAYLEVVDLSDPDHPVRAATVALPEAAGHTLLRAAGKSVLSSHWVPLQGNPSKARFYLDRIDVSEPGAPELPAPINVPGSLLAYDAERGRVLTVDYQRETRHDVTAEQCGQQYGYDYCFEPADQYSYDYTSPGTCTRLHRVFKLLDIEGAAASLRGAMPIEDGTQLSSLLQGQDRIFAWAYNYDWQGDDPYSWYGRLMVLSAFETGSIALATVDAKELSSAYPIEVSGRRLVLARYDVPSVTALDAADLDDLHVGKTTELRAWANRARVDGDRVLCALGTWGLQVVELGD
ncbi:MAG: hypothetical protein HY744_12405 [Deltaproteobacteria bacterium]|nr:hypothetical protein [Deltaproteobacteria bacterium]